MNQFSQSQVKSSVGLEVSRFMSRVYGWMMFGLLITSVTGFVIGSSPEYIMTLSHGGFTMAIVFQFVLVLALSFGLKRMSVGMATACFLLYSFVSGITFSTIFLSYSLNVIGQVFAITAGTFGAMAVFGFVTKKNLDAMGTFFMMGLFGIVIAAIVNIFMHSAALDFGISVISVAVFAGLTAYDVQKLKQIGASGQNDTDMGHKFAVMGALMLYLDFINLFLALLRIFGGRSRD